MGSMNAQNIIAICNELRAYVEEHHLFPQKHSRLSHKVKYTRKKINEGTLEEWKRVYASTFPHCSMKSSENLWPKTKRLVKDERRSKSKLRVCA